MHVGSIASTYEEAKDHLTVFEEQWASGQTELFELKKDRADKLKSIENATLESKKIVMKISRFQKDNAEAANKIAQMLKQYIWIASEQSSFGVAGGDYDFQATNPERMSNDLDKLQKEQGSLVSLCVSLRF
jgi:structural maintenance of chromosome 2